MTKPKKMGRPWPPGERKTRRVQLQVRRSDYAKWKAAAESAGVKLTAWIERACAKLL